MLDENVWKRNVIDFLSLQAFCLWAFKKSRLSWGMCPRSSLKHIGNDLINMHPGKVGLAEFGKTWLGREVALQTGITPAMKCAGNT